MSFDGKAVEYSTSEKKVLIRAPKTLEEYTVLRSCEEIVGGNSASASPFFLCKDKLRTVDFEPNSALNTLGGFCFSQLTALRSVDFGNCNHLQSLSKNIFEKCSSLETVILPPNLKYFNSYCFAYDQKLKRISIPDSVFSLSYMMFTNSGMENIEISMTSKMNKIETEALRNTKLTSFFIAKDIKYLDGSMFMSTPTLSTITIHPDNHNFFIHEQTLVLSANKSILLFSTKGGKVVVPDCVSVIGYGCFRGSQVTEIEFKRATMDKFEGWFCAENRVVTFTFPKGITEIPHNAFSYSQTLKNVYLTDSIAVIKQYAFSYCPQLVTIDLLKVQEIGEYCFFSCSKLQNLKLPSTVTSIGMAAFSNCPLINVDCKDNEKFEITNGMFFTDNKATLIDYFGTNKVFEIPSICTKIGNSALSEKKITKVTFQESSSLTILKEAFKSSTIEEIVFPASLKSISENCFEHCKSLTTVTFKECQLNTICDFCFANCTSLSSINVIPTLKYIKINAFYNCTKLTSFAFETSILVSIGNHAFAESGLTSATFPQTLETVGVKAFAFTPVVSFDFTQSSVTEVSQSCFEDCKVLTDMKFSSKTEVIQTLAFSNCIRLSSITLPLGIRTINTMAFENCAELETVKLTINCNLESVKGRAFSNCPKLKSIFVEENDEKFTFELGALLTKNKSKLIFYLPSSKTTIYVVPAPVSEVGPFAFEDCSNLQTIVIPDGNIKSLGASSFAGCTSLSLMYLPVSISWIGEGAFDRCTSLKCGSFYTAGSEELNNLLKGVNINPIMFSTDCPSFRTRDMYKCYNIKYSIFFTLFALF